jgi:cyclopropane fatty-acyl-phospholipid synthase-like methyltransferase
MTGDLISILLLAVMLLLAWVVLGPVIYGAPWHWTRKQTVRRTLDLCEAKPGETLVDLGSGDGRVLITAAREYGLKGVGLEIDPVKVWASRLLVKLAGVGDRVTILRRNVHDHDYHDADILFLYMTHQVVDRLFPAVYDQLKPGARVVTHRFCLRGQSPDKMDSQANLFLYTGDKGRQVDNWS